MYGTEQVGLLYVRLYQVPGQYSFVLLALIVVTAVPDVASKRAARVGCPVYDGHAWPLPRPIGVASYVVVWVAAKV